MSFLRKQSLFTGALYSVILIWCVLLILTAAAVFLCSKEILPIESMKLTIILCEILSILIVSTSISGVFAKKYLIFCMICAGIYSFSFAVIAVCVENTSISIKWLIENIAYCFLGGIAAALIHLPYKKNRRKRKVSRI